MADGPVTRIEWVEEQLRRALLSGELKPGERLLTAQLSERFAVSPTPLREALHRFAGEGLVEFLPQRGARVTPLTRGECSELAELRSILDPLAADHAIAHADDEWRKAVEGTSSQLQAALTAEPHDGQPSEEAYRAFYDALTSTCDSRLLRRIANAIRDQEARYRLATIAHIDRDRFLAGHRRLVKAAVGGDGVAVRRAMIKEVEAFAACYLKLGPTELESAAAST